MGKRRREDVLAAHRASRSLAKADPRGLEKRASRAL
jgi:hypothetical protein